MIKTMQNFILLVLISSLFFSCVPFSASANNEILPEQIVNTDDELINIAAQDENLTARETEMLRESVLNENVVPDGIYAFKNLGNTDRWMDVQYNQTNPGYHMQQYAFGISPSIVPDNNTSGLYKVTRVPNTNRYIIRLCINNNLTFYVDNNNEVLTKTIPSNDADVALSDTFYIVYNNGGYTIQQVTTTLFISAHQGSYSGSSDAPLSYLYATFLQAAGDNARWIIEGYQSQIPNGVYAFENIGNSENISDGSLWMDVRYDKTIPGYPIQQYKLSQSPAETFTRNSLFKVTQYEQTGKYTIRLMLNNILSFSIVSNDVITSIITNNDQSPILDDELYYIVFYNGGYAIRPTNTNTYYISAKNSTASGSTGGNYSKLTIRTMPDAQKRALWKLHQYTGTDQTGYSTTCSEDISNGIQLSQIVDIYYAFWSTITGTNKVYVSCQYYYIDYVTYYQTEQRLNIVANDLGTVVASAKYYINNQAYINYNSYNIILIEDMTDFFIQNIGYLNYMMNNNGYLYQNVFNGELSQTWKFIYVGNGYYKIISSNSGMAITVPTGYEYSNNVYLSLETYTGSDNQKWKISTTSNSNYKLKAKSSEQYAYLDLVMSVQTNNNPTINPTNNGLNIIQAAFSDDNDYKDEWHIYCLNGSSIYFYAAKFPVGVDRVSEYGMIFNYLYKMGKMYYKFENLTSTTSNDLIQNIGESLISVLRGPGGYNSNSIYIELNNSPLPNVLCSTDIVGNQSTIEDIVIFGSSYSAKSILGVINFTTAIINYGASNSIGFNSYVAESGLNDWTESFFSNYSENNSIPYSFINANTENGSLIGISVLQSAF